MKRGDIFIADLYPRSGSEQHGRRPVIIISHDGFNEVAAWRSVNVVPVTTSKRQSQRGKTAILLPKGAGNLAKDSVAVCHQLTTLDKSKLQKYIGTLPSSSLLEVDDGILAALNIWRD